MAFQRITFGKWELNECPKIIVVTGGAGDILPVAPSLCPWGILRMYFEQTL